MNKQAIIGTTFLVLLCLLLSFISFKDEKKNKETKNQQVIQQEEETEIRAVYVSYIELSKYLDKPTVNEQKENISKIIRNLKSDGFNWILLHTRSFSDSIYPSEIFPSNYMITRDEKKTLELDILQEFIDQAHKENIQIHAWINPFRIRNNEDETTITESNPCYKWIGSNHVKKIEGKGIFYNPASIEVQELIVRGIQEIIENYEVDGIHLDDYFYPDPTKTIDLENYNQYLLEGGTLSIDKYRLENVNKLIRKIYQTIHSTNKNIVFGIAPDGNIQNNYQENYVDLLTWLKEDEYVDYIMPQLYYGFQNETKPYIEILNDWNSYIENEEIDLIPALALYKTGQIDLYAKTGKNEWLEHSNIVANQIQVARTVNNYKGFALFRYDYFYESQNEITKKENVEIQKILQENP